jgi:hypothetical protein
MIWQLGMVLTQGLLWGCRQDGTQECYHMKVWLGLENQQVSHFVSKVCWFLREAWFPYHWASAQTEHPENLADGTQKLYLLPDLLLESTDEH